MTPVPAFAILEGANQPRSELVNERNIVAAILAAGVAHQVQQSSASQSFTAAAQQAVSLYQVILAELAKANLPPQEFGAQWPNHQLVPCAPVNCGGCAD
jgi:hypothetical protein